MPGVQPSDITVKSIIFSVRGTRGPTHTPTFRVTHAPTFNSTQSPTFHLTHTDPTTTPTFEPTHTPSHSPIFERRRILHSEEAIDEEEDLEVSVVPGQSAAQIGRAHV